MTSLKLVPLFILVPIFYVLFPVVILTIIIPNFMFRTLIQMLKNLLRNDIQSIVTPLSNLFGVDKLYGSPSSTLIMASVYEGIITKEFVCQLISEKWLMKHGLNGKLAYPELQQGLTSYLGYQFWKNDTFFNVNNHVKVLEIRDKFIRKESLNEVFVRIVNEPFKEFQSPWEIIIMQQYDKREDPDRSNDSTSLVIFKVHHALMDGLTMMKLGQRDLGNINIGDTSFLKSCHTEDHSYLMKCLAFFRLPYFAANFFVKGQPLILNNRRFSPERRKQVKVFATEKVSLTKIKDIRSNWSKYKVSLTSILLAGYVSGLRHFLIKTGLIHRNSSPTCMVPVPLPKHPDKLRNHMSFVSLQLPIHEKDSHRRLLKIHKRLDSSRKSLDPLSLYYALTIIGSLPTFILRIFLRKSPVSFLLSNFPGPLVPLTISSHRCTDIFFNGGLLEGNIHMVFSCVGYNNAAKFTVSTDDCILKSNLDAKEFMQIIIKEFDDLAASAPNIYE